MDRTSTVREIAGQCEHTAMELKLANCLWFCCGIMATCQVRVKFFWFVKLYQTYSTWMKLNQLVHRNCRWLFMETYERRGTSNRQRWLQYLLHFVRKLAPIWNADGVYFEWRNSLNDFLIQFGLRLIKRNQLNPWFK